MNEVKKWNWSNKAKDVVAVLNACKFDAHYAEDGAEAKKIVESLLEEGATIGVGGSVTLNETGIMELIQDPKYQFIDRFHVKDWDEQQEKYREALTADIFVSSVNAITMDGKLVNLECTGNRTAAIEFGPRKVIIVAGANKVVDSLEDGMRRAKAIAPLNAKRIGHQTPCAVNGVCVDCESTQRLCNIWSIIDGCFKYPGRISVIVVAEELGY